MIASTLNMGIEAKEIKIVPISKLKHYGLNRNKHPKDQIDRLAKLIESHGMRDPLTVDKDTMEVITGNGTLMACKKLKMKEVPVIFQSFETDEQRYAFSVSHNAINQWAEIDLSQIHIDLPDMSAFDLDLLGFKNFRFEPIEAPEIDDFMEADKNKLKFFTCPHCEKEFEEKQGTVRVVD